MPPSLPFGIGTKATNRPAVIRRSLLYLPTPVSPFHAEPLQTKSAQVTIIDSTPPARPSGLYLTNIANVTLVNGVTNTPSVVLHGTIARTGLLVQIYDATTHSDLGYATVLGTTFTASLTLAEGSHNLQVTTINSGNYRSSITPITATIDLTKPTSLVNPSVTISPTSLITGTVSATDPGSPSSGITSAGVYVAIDNNPFAATPFVTLNPGNLNFTYQGTPGHRYYFRSIATDNAGNVETKTTIDASTFIATPPPVTTVVSSTPNASNATFTISVVGTDQYGPGLASFAVYVKINSGSGYGPLIPVGNVAAGTPDGTGVYHASIPYQASQDGISKSYQFFCIGTDTVGRVETAHTNPDVTVSNQTFAQAPIAFTGLTIQHGLLERSFIQYVDIDFNEGGPALQTLYNNLVAHPANYLQLLDRAYGASTNTPISLSGVTISLDSLDNAIELNFGPNGLGGVARGNLSLAAFWSALISGDGWYEMNVDVTGNSGFASAPHGSFERLLGDTNGDGTVDATDVNLVTILQGMVATGTNANGDLNGDGTIDATDKYLVGKSKGRTLQVNPFK